MITQLSTVRNRESVYFTDVSVMVLYYTPIDNNTIIHLRICC